MKQVMIHMGAHRCASTAVQALMRQYRAEIEAHGTALFLRPDMEAENARLDLRGLFRDSRWNPLASARLGHLVRAVEALPEKRILISEENLIGTMPGLHDKRFYPGFGNFLRFLQHLGRQTELSVRLITRRQDRLLDSIYAFRVAFGLPLDFPSFMRQVDTAGMSWLKMARAVDKAELASRTRIQVLEAWPREQAVLQAQQFLGIDTLFDATGYPLRGNASFSARDLRLLLALNRMKVGTDIGWRREKLFKALRARTDETDADILVTTGLTLKAEQMHRIAELTAAPVQLKLTDEERARLVKRHADDNRLFLKHPVVGTDEGLWAEAGRG